MYEGIQKGIAGWLFVDWSWPPGSRTVAPKQTGTVDRCPACLTKRCLLLLLVPHSDSPSVCPPFQSRSVPAKSLPLREMASLAADQVGARETRPSGRSDEWQPSFYLDRYRQHCLRASWPHVGKVGLGKIRTFRRGRQPNPCPPSRCVSEGWRCPETKDGHS